MGDTMHPFENTATGILGDKRDTMLSNPLLLRSELGRPMRRGYTEYPGTVWRYGRPNPDNNGGTNEALTGWSASGLHFPNRPAGDAGTSKSAIGVGDRDFMALNREAVKKGLVRSNEQYQFRATHDIRKRPAASAGAGDGAGAGAGDGAATRPGPRRLPPSMVFGISTRPSTPIHDLLENRYQDRWLAEKRSEDMAQRKQQQQAQQSDPSSMNVRLGKVNETRASQLRIHHVPVQSAPLWKLPKFRNARASLETFRRDGDKQMSYTHAATDGIGRKGGMGVYVEACN